MTKDDVKKYLIENGASEILIQMPAVMERIYSYFETIPESMYSGYTGTIISMNGLLPKQFRKLLVVEPDGNITIRNGADTRKFEIRPEGEAVYINEDEGIMGIDENGEYKIDKYGMDKSFEGKDGVIVFRNDKGRIIGKIQEFADDGSPILNAGYYLERRPNRDDELNKMWEVNREELITNYPNTIKWFELRETSKQAEYQEQDDEIVITGLVDDFTDQIDIPMPEEKKSHNKKKIGDEKSKDEIIENLQRRDEENSETIITLRNTNQRKDEIIEELEQQNFDKDEQIRNLQTETEEREQRIADLQTRNSSLQERNTKLQQMLSIALNKLQQIKSSIFGRFFFTKEERKEARKAKKLPESKEQNTER